MENTEEGHGVCFIYKEAQKQKEYESLRKVKTNLHKAGVSFGWKLLEQLVGNVHWRKEEDAQEERGY